MLYVPGSVIIQITIHRVVHTTPCTIEYTICTVVRLYRAHVCIPGLALSLYKIKCFFIIISLNCGFFLNRSN
jgi:hypothetical protein